MKILFSLIKDRINFWLLLPIIALSTILTGMITVNLNHYIPNYAQGLPKILLQPKTTIILLLLWLATLTLYILLYYSLSKNPKLKDYVQIYPPGYMQHKITQKKCCQPCLIKHHRESELSPVNQHLLLCRCCKQGYSRE